MCLDEEGASSERNRAIWSQDPTMMLLAGYFNAHLIKSLKPVLPSFIHGLSCEGLEDKLKTQVPLRYVQFAADTSGHDSSQYTSLITSVDNYYIQLVSAAIITKMRKYVHISASMEQSLVKAMTLTNVPYIVRDKKGKIYEKGKIDGTVRSGDATKTTFGNTLRVSMYLEYAMLGAPYDFIVWVSGDDASVWFEQQHEEDVLHRMFTRAYVRQPDTTGSLG